MAIKSDKARQKNRNFSSKTGFSKKPDFCPQSRWQSVSRLFSNPGEEFAKALELLPKAIEKIWHIPSSKRKFLPADIADLSRLLTRSRGELGLPYWHKAANLSAYLYYFLPWNIIRLGSLFSSLPLPKPEEIDGYRPVLLDMGSGPLALPIALWLARKEWRKIPLQVLALDSSKQPLDVGRELFYTLAKLMGEKAWQVFGQSGSAEKPLMALQALRAKNTETKFYPWLLTEANILNELISKSPSRNFGWEDLENTEDYEEDEECESSLLGRLLNSWIPIWKDSPAKPLALFVEPGTRLGGDAIMNLRRCAIRLGFEPLAPCTHANKCPLLNKIRASGSQAESWCHFTFSAIDAPKWLQELSRESGLEKTSLSLSILLLGDQKPTNLSKTSARIISQPFRVPGLQGEARYACASSGLELLENAGRLLSGTLTQAQKKVPVRTDKKSGAVICIPAEESKSNKNRA